jgi:hypothetical protein
MNKNFHLRYDLSGMYRKRNNYCKLGKNSNKSDIAEKLHLRNNLDSRDMMKCLNLGIS